MNVEISNKISPEQASEICVFLGGKGLIIAIFNDGSKPSPKNWLNSIEGREIIIRKLIEKNNNSKKYYKSLSNQDLQLEILGYMCRFQ